MPKKHKNQAVHMVEEEEDEDDEIAVKKSRTDPLIPTDEARKAQKSKKKKVQLTIETVKGNPDKISPLLGYFPTGFDPLKQQQGSEQPRVRVLKNVKRPNRMQLVVSPTESPVEFVGTNYMGEATTPQVCTYALGIVDKQAQTLKIVQIEANKIFRLEPKVGDSHLTEDAPLGGAREETAEEKANKSLKYTTSKTQRKAKILESLRRNQDPESQKNLDKKLDGIEINIEALGAAAADTTMTNARNIPPHDMSTDNVANAYPIHKIIFAGEWDYLNDIAKLLQDGKEVEHNSYPIFVCNRVHLLDEMKDEEAKANLAGIFSYISHLIKFKDKYSMDGFLSAKNHKFPRILSEKFNTMFANSDSKKLADDKRDLLISYVLVLTLIADRFKTDPSDIAKDLRMNPVALRVHFEFLGCKLKREGSVLLAELKAPLQFPTIRMRRRR